MDIPEQAPATSSPASSNNATKPHRVLACVLCQHRKIRCDRKFPCSHCVRVDAQCVPATRAPHQRHRRFAERDLLERLRRYEALLRQNNIDFEPLHGSTEKTVPRQDGRSSRSPDGASVASGDQNAKEVSVKAEPDYETKSLWVAMSHKQPYDHDDEDSDEDAEGEDNIPGTPPNDLRRVAIRKAWNHLFTDNDQFLFGARKHDLDLSLHHPDQVQIFRLWQTYLNNVNPLLRVIHTPTLQPRIIDAAADVSKISPSLEALMFSIYSMAILSLVEDECRSWFGSPRADLLKSYQFECQQALMKCNILRTSDRVALTALFLYLISSRPYTDPRSMSSMLGIAVRIAQRMGMHSESTNAKCNALEAEMRRRLWWSLVIFDNRTSEMSDYKTSVLNPTWDCRTPLNLNDFDLSPEIRSPPAVHDIPTEALFTVVRSEVGDFVRHSSWHLDFANPSLKSIAKYASSDADSETSIIETLVEEKYFLHCNLENPLHFLTIWTTRAYFAKNRLLEHYAHFPNPSTPPSEADLASVSDHALAMLSCDTKLVSSPLTKGFLWFTHIHFPFVAYIHLVQDLTRRPQQPGTARIWDIMSDNYATRFLAVDVNVNPFHRILAKMVMSAWEACQAVSGRGRNSMHGLSTHIRQAQSSSQTEVPRIVIDMRRRLAEMKLNSPKARSIEQAQQGLTNGGDITNDKGTNVDTFPSPPDIVSGVDLSSLGLSSNSSIHELEQPQQQQNQQDIGNSSWVGDAYNYNDMLNLGTGPSTMDMDMDSVNPFDMTSSMQWTWNPMHATGGWTW